MFSTAIVRQNAESWCNGLNDSWSKGGKSLFQLLKMWEFLPLKLSRTLRSENEKRIRIFFSAMFIQYYHLWNLRRHTDEREFKDTEDFFVIRGFLPRYLIWFVSNKINHQTSTGNSSLNIQR